MAGKVGGPIPMTPFPPPGVLPPESAPLRPATQESTDKVKGKSKAKARGVGTQRAGQEPGTAGGPAVPLSRRGFVRCGALVIRGAWI